MNDIEFSNKIKQLANEYGLEKSLIYDIYYMPFSLYPVLKIKEHGVFLGPYNYKFSRFYKWSELTLNIINKHFNFCKFKNKQYLTKQRIKQLKNDFI